MTRTSYATTSDCHPAPARWVAVVALLLVIATALMMAGCKAKTTTTAPTARPTAAKSDSPWVAVTLLDGNTYFGHPSDVGDANYKAYDDVFFMTDAKASDGKGHLRRFGGEIHKPLAQLVVPSTAVVFEQPLSEKSSAVAAIAAFEAGSPPPAAAQPTLPSGGPVAVFLRNGDVFFGKCVSTGETASIENAYYLRYRDQSAANAGQIKSLDELALVPQSSTEIGPSGAMRIQISSVLYIQPLAKDSPVTVAIGK